MDTIKPYFGEFFISPCPLEMSGTRCSHNCSYCFANLNKPKRKFDYEGTVRLIKNRHSRKSLEAQLLSIGYPVLISNHVDPFSISNYREMVPVMRLLAEEGIPISIQTRGGKGIDEVLSFLPPSVWYVSITHDQDETRASIERQAPSIESRFELIDKLISHDHRVVVGANPLHPDWIREPAVFFQKLASYGVEGVWLEILHLNYKQRDNMAPIDRQYLTEETIKLAMKRKPTERWTEFFEECQNLVCKCGMEVFSIGQPHFSRFFEPWREVYPKTFPVMQDWVNHCQQEMGDTGVFTFEDWRQKFAPPLSRGQASLPAEVDSSQLYHYIEFGAQRRDSGVVIPKIRTYQDLLPLCWQNEKFPRANPINCAAFGYLADNVNGEPKQIVDQKGLPIFGFVAEGTSAKYLIR